MSTPPDTPFGPAVQDILKRVCALPRAQTRQLVAIAGVPAGGKSTLAALLANSFTECGIHAANVPMDGFHLDNRLLEARGLLHRKGAPETFDAAGFVNLVKRLKIEDEVIYPVFDRQLDLAVAGAGIVPTDCEVVLVEGNYLLFDEGPWRELTKSWDFSVWVETSEQTVLERCVQRWLDHGHDIEAARARAMRNDVANAKLINALRLPADLTVSERECA